MAGIANDYLVYPIMDLIQGELKKVMSSSKVEADPFGGPASVALRRDHPRDPDKVTGARMMYETGYIADVYMEFGCGDDFSGVPIEVDGSHPDWEYYTRWRLETVSTFLQTPQEELLTTLIVKLNYENQQGNLIGTTLTRI